MIFSETSLKGAYLIEPEKRADQRGFFARVYCQEEFEAQGLVARVAQTNMSFSPRRGTLRGLHYQVAPFAETKLIRCTKGAIYDVIVDLRPNSPTYLRWLGVELTSENYRMLYVPEGFARGFMTLTDNTEVTYQVSQFYTSNAERGARYNDPAFGIEWPIQVNVISDKDANWPDFKLDN